MTEVATAIAEGKLGSCLWLYSNFHCNLACGYCLTESSPSAKRRALGDDRMLALTREAADLGFKSVGIAGGEPFLVKTMPELIAAMAEVLPVIVLTNGTLFTDRLLDRLRPLAELPVSLQVSLDSAQPDLNDRLREAGNFAAVTATLPKLIALGLRVRIATTGGDEASRKDLCALHRSLGIGEGDHIVRPIVHRGRAVDLALGVAANTDTLPPELTITTEGAYWSPFAPTVQAGRMDTDLLLTRTVSPLRKPAEVMLRLVQGRPPGTDTTLGIR